MFITAVQICKMDLYQTLIDTDSIEKMFTVNIVVVSLLCF